MPLAGYLGFLPFALECYAGMVFARIICGAKGSLFKDEGRKRKARWIMALVSILFVVTTLYLMDERTVISCSTSIGNIPAISEEEEQILSRNGIRTTDDLLEAFGDETIRDELVKSGIEKRRWRLLVAASDLLRMPSVEGGHAFILARAGVNGVEELARMEREEVKRHIGKTIGKEEDVIAGSDMERWLDDARDFSRVMKKL